MNKRQATILASIITIFSLNASETATRIDNPRFISISGSLIIHGESEATPISKFLGHDNPLKILTIFTAHSPLAKKRTFCAELPTFLLPQCIDKKFWDNDNWILVKECPFDSEYDYTLFIGIKDYPEADSIIEGITSKTLDLARTPAIEREEKVGK